MVPSLEPYMIPWVPSGMNIDPECIYPQNVDPGVSPEHLCMYPFLKEIKERSLGIKESHLHWLINYILILRLNVTGKHLENLEGKKHIILFTRLLETFIRSDSERPGGKLTFRFYNMAALKNISCSGILQQPVLKIFFRCQSEMTIAIYVEQDSVSLLKQLDSWEE